MQVKYKNIEPSQVRADDCSKLRELDKLEMSAHVDRFINVIKKSDSQDIGKLDIREGVVGVVAPWGSGKSFFLNLLFCKVKNNYSVVYMDGSDYRNDENIELAVLKAIANSNTVKEKLQKTAKSIFAKTVNTAKFLSLKALSYSLKEEGVDELDGLLKNLGSETIDLLMNEMSESPQEKLKRELSHTAKDYPLIVIIDNLDRCDADFTLKFLTKIKEIFNIPNLLFVVAYDKEKIKNFVKQNFGDDGTTGFLRKYIAAEFYLPNFENKAKDIITHLYKSKIECFINDSIDSSDKSDTSKNPIELLENLYKNTPLTLRMIEQIFNRSITVIQNNYKNYKDDHRKVADLFSVLACKYLDEDYYYNNFYKNYDKTKTLIFFKQKSTDETSQRGKFKELPEDFSDIQKQIELNPEDKQK